MVVHDKLSSALRTFATANPFSTLEESGRVLSTLLSNLAREDTPKFRRVNLTNAKIKAAVLGAAVGVSALVGAAVAAASGSASLVASSNASAAARAGDELAFECLSHVALMSARGARALAASRRERGAGAGAGMTCLRRGGGQLV